MARDSGFAEALAKKKPRTAANANAESGEGGSKKPPSRRGAKQIGGHFPPEVGKQLKQLAVAEDSTVQDLLGEALDMLFQSRRVPTIARK